MALTFAQAAAAATDETTRAALQIAIAESTVWDRLHFEDIPGNAYAYDKDHVLPGTGFRTVNEAYVESTGVVNGDVEVLTILGGDADVDSFLEQTRSSARSVLMAGQVRMKIASAQATYANAFFNGDTSVDPKGFDGLRKRLVGSQVIDATANASQTAFLADIDTLLAAVSGDADVIYAPKALIGKLKALGRTVGGADYINSEITGKREFTWNGTPIIDPGKHWNGTPILSVGASGAEMYAVRLARSDGEEGVLGICNGPLSAKYLGELQEKPAIRTRIDFYAAMVVQGGNAAARLRGIWLS